MKIRKTLRKIRKTLRKIKKTFRKWIDKIINHKYYDYQKIKPGVSIIYDAKTLAHLIQQKEMELF
jgi:hypothetical protein